MKYIRRFIQVYVIEAGTVKFDISKDIDIYIVL